MTKDEIITEAFKQLPDAQTYSAETFTVIINNKKGITPIQLSGNNPDTEDFDESTSISITFRKHLYYPEHGLSCKATWQIE